MSRSNPESTTPTRGGLQNLFMAKLPVLLPIAVVLGAAATLGYGLWPMVQPAREVRVVQAVFDRSADRAAAWQPVSNSVQEPAQNVPTVQAPGWLEPEPYFTAAAALTDGVVQEITVLEGEYVKKGDVVARLVAEDSELRYRNARASLLDAEARLMQAQADFEAAQSNWQEPIALEQAVAVGKAELARARAELARMPALIASAQATLIQLHEEYDRVERLRASGSSTQTEVIVARQKVEAQRETLNATKAQVPVREAQVQRLEADLQAAERDLKLRISDTQRLATARARRNAAQAAVEQATVRKDEAALELSRTVIRAPISGYVMNRLKGPGDKVVRNMDDMHSVHLVHLYDPKKLQVRVDVPLADAAHISVGQACEIVVEVLPGRTFRGEVIRSVHKADLQKNTLQYKVRVIDPADILRPEMLTRVKFLPPSPSPSQEADASGPSATGPAVLIPESALDTSADRPRVWTITDRRASRGKLMPVTVDTIKSQDGWLLVRGDLHAGSLLTPDYSQATPGQAVRFKTGAIGGAV